MRYKGVPVFGNNIIQSLPQTGIHLKWKYKARSFNERALYFMDLIYCIYFLPTYAFFATTFSDFTTGLSLLISSASPNALSFAKSTNIGAATKIEE